MDSLKGSPAHTRHLRPLWLRLVVLFIILALAIVGSTPAAAAPSHKWEWPRCNWACSANDVWVTGAWLGGSQTDPDAELPASCSAGETVTAYLWVEVYNRTGSDRYAYGVVADVVVGSTTSADEVTCVDGTIGPGETKAVMVYGPFSWPCGAEVSLENVVVFWDTDSGATCTTQCAGHPMGQCKAISRWDVVVPCDLTLEVTPATAILTCEEPQVELEAEVTGATSFTCTWYLGDTVVGSGLTCVADTAGVYRAVASAGGCTASDTAVVDYDPSMPTVEVFPASAQLPCPSGQIMLTALVSAPIQVDSPQPAYSLQWYRDGAAIAGATEHELVVGTPGLYRVKLTLGECEVWSNPVQVRACGEEEPVCIRADVSAIIWGGWDGIPVQAWVDGTAQETLFTARDASGEAAVLWTFYPPEGDTWNVVVTPQLPAGLDPARWTYEPASKSVSIERCSEHQLTFQLIDTGPQVEVILPVTGGRLSWWQSVLAWLRGLLGS